MGIYSTKEKIIKEYHIQNNGGIPYKVTCEEINNKYTVNIYEIIHRDSSDEENDDVMFRNDPIYTYYPQKVFIGSSPKIDMTEFSGAYGSEWDGNTILLHMESNKYIFIYRNISSFESIGIITSFVSPVSDNTIPFPYAIDEYNNYYLLDKNVIIKSLNLDRYDDPYTYYYDYMLLTDDHTCIPQKKCKKIFKNIVTFLCNNEISTLFYNPFPEKKNTYFFDNKDRLSIVDINNNTLQFSWNDYISLMNEVAITYNFIPLWLNVIHYN